MTDRPRLGPRLMIATGIPFGLAMGASLAHDPMTFAATAALAGSLYGVGMALTFTAMSALRGADASRAEPHQERVLRLTGRPEALLQAARERLHQRGVGRFRVDQPGAGLLEGHTPWTWQSFGTVVSVSVGAVDDHGTCQVHVRTRPRMPTQMIDYGVAAALVDDIEAAMVDAADLPEGQRHGQVAAQRRRAAQQAVASSQTV